MSRNFKYIIDPKKELEYRKSLSMLDIYAYFTWRGGKDLEGKVIRNFRCSGCGRGHDIFVKEGDKPKCSFCGKKLDEYIKKVVRTSQSDTVVVPRAYDKLGRPVKNAGTVRVSRKASENSF
jgi:hypothetical protein